MIRRIAGVALVIVMMFAFPIILLAEDVSLDSLEAWIKDIAHEQYHQAERISALEERVELLSAALTATPTTTPRGSPPPGPPPTGLPPSDGPSIPGGENPNPGEHNSTIPIETPTPIPAPALQGYASSYLLGAIELSWNSYLTLRLPYELQVRTLGQQWRTINRARPYISSFQHTGLENGITYYYRIRAIPHMEDPGPWSEEVWIRTLRPDEISTPTPIPTPSP